MRVLALLALLGPLSHAVHGQADCTQTSSGLVPLTDLGTGTYQGYEGGLYPGGVNHRPAAHDQAGRDLSLEIVPRDAAGAPDAVDGQVVLLAIGFSVVKQSFDAYMQIAGADPEVNSKLTIVNGARHELTVEGIADPDANYWDFLPALLQQNGATNEQVQAVWFVEASYQTPAFPQNALDLTDNFVTIMQIIRDLFPNLKIVYVSSRIYGNYSFAPAIVEPYSYENGFAAKWLIERQIQGDPALAFDPAQGPVESPWLSWGPYNWADGLEPSSNGMTWECADFEPLDGHHPAASGEQKVGQRLHDFLRTDVTARPWYFEGTPPSTCSVQAISETYGAPDCGVGDGMQIVASEVPTLPTAGPLRVLAWDGPPNCFGAFSFGYLPLAPGQVKIYGGDLLVLPLFLHLASTSPAGKASWTIGTLPPDLSLCAAELYFQYACLDGGTPQGATFSCGLRVRLGN